MLLIANTFVSTPGRALAGFGLVALGLPVYAYDNRHRPHDGDRHPLAPTPADAHPLS